MNAVQCLVLIQTLVISSNFRHIIKVSMWGVHMPYLCQGFSSVECGGGGLPAENHVRSVHEDLLCLSFSLLSDFEENLW